MSRRPGTPPPGRGRPERPASSPLALRLIVGAAVAVLVVALIVGIATGTLFATPGGR